MKIPKRLYHAAPQCAFDAINAEGLKSDAGLIYAASTPEEALTFMWFRLLDHPHYEQQDDGKLSFELVAHNRIDIFEIMTARTNVALWEEGTDHSSSFFGGANSWVYLDKNIKRDALSKVLPYFRSDIESAVAARHS